MLDEETSSSRQAFFTSTLVVETPSIAMSFFLGMLIGDPPNGHQAFHFTNGQ